jgi:hypothetical protein
LARNENGGLYLFGGRYIDSNFVLGKTLSVKYPTTVENAWEKANYTFTTRDSSFYISDTLLMTCISTNEKFITNLGEMECYVYSYQRNYDDKTDNIKLYYSKNIGYVGSVSERNGVLRKKTLKSYGLLKTQHLTNQFQTETKTNSIDYYSEFDIK